MDRKKFAETVMFYLGMAFMFVTVYAMTPLTHQLDDIKVTLIHIFGPVLLIVYFAFLALGWLERPRRGIWVPLVLFFFVMLLSFLFTRSYIRWQAWLGIAMQWVLLGPFVAFLSCSHDAPRLKKIAVFFMIMTLGSTLFGLAHRYGAAEKLVDHYREPIEKVLRARSVVISQYRALETRYADAADPTVQASLASQLRAKRQQALSLGNEYARLEQGLKESSIYKLALTFGSKGARNQMLSVVLNRAFYAAFLLMMLPISIGVFLTSGGWYHRLINTQSRDGRLKALLSWGLLLQVLAVVTVITGLICLRHTRSKISLYLGIEVTFVAIFLLYVFAANIPWKRRGLFVASIISLILVVTPLGILFSKGTSLLQHLQPENISELTRSFVVSFTSRAIIWEGAVRAWLDSAILGNGRLSFGIMFPFFRRPDYYLFEISHRTIFAHNYFLDLLQETGLAGFCCIIFFLLFIFYKVFQAIRRDPDPRICVLALCFLAGMLGFLTNNAVSPNSRWPIGAINLWANLGVLAGIINRKRQPDGAAIPAPPIRPSHKNLAWGLCILSFIGWIYTSHYGIQYFRSSMANNIGLTITGEGGGNPETVYGYREALTQARQQMRQANLSSAQKQQLDERITELEANFARTSEDAIRAFRRAIEINPYFTTSYYKLATLLFQGKRNAPQQEDLLRALAAYRKLQEYGPEYSQVRLNLASCFHNLNKPEKAIEQYDMAAEMTIDPDIIQRYLSSLNRIARSRVSPRLSPHDIKDPAGLLKWMEDDSPLAASIRDLRSTRTLALAKSWTPRQQRKWRKAVEEFENAQTEYYWLQDGREKARWKKRMEEAENKLAPLQQAYENICDSLAIDLTQQVTGPVWYDETLLQQVDLSYFSLDHLATWNRMGDDYPRKDVQRFNRALLDDALRDFIERNPQDELTGNARRLVEWWVEIIDKDKPISRRYYPQRKDIREKTVQMYAYWSQLANAAYREQRRALHWALEYIPGEERMLNYLGNLYQEYQDITSMRDYLEGYTEKYPADTLAQSWLAIAEINLNNLQAARKHIAGLSKIAPQDPSLHYLLFRLAEKEGRQKAAGEKAALYQKEGNNPYWKQEVISYLLPSKSQME